MSAESLSPAPIDPADLPTLPEPSAPVTRWLGLAYSASLTTYHDAPYVFETIAEARELVAAMRDGGRTSTRELVGGAIVEREYLFPGGWDDVTVALHEWSGEPVDFDEHRPEVIATIGPRGGVRHERT